MSKWLALAALALASIACGFQADITPATVALLPTVTATNTEPLARSQPLPTPTTDTARTVGSWNVRSSVGGSVSVAQVTDAQIAIIERGHFDNTGDEWWLVEAVGKTGYIKAACCK